MKKLALGLLLVGIVGCQEQVCICSCPAKNPTPVVDSGTWAYLPDGTKVYGNYK